MKETAVLILACIPPTILLLTLISVIVYNIWYSKNYKDKNGWHKCWDCKKVESEIYFTNTIHGRIYKCLNCSKCEN